MDDHYSGNTTTPRSSATMAGGDQQDETTIGIMVPSSHLVPIITEAMTDEEPKEVPISFRVPQVVKDTKTKRGTISLEKNKVKKNKSGKKKGIDPTHSSIFFNFMFA
jgi:hypothetical protein